TCCSTRPTSPQRARSSSDGEARSSCTGRWSGRGSRRSTTGGEPAPLSLTRSALEVHTEARSYWLTRRRGERGGSEGAEGWFWVCRAAETSRRDQGSLVVVVCSGRVAVRGVEPASPGSLLGGMSQDPTGRNHIHHERGSGRGTLGSTTNAARPGNLLRVLRVSV